MRTYPLRKPPGHVPPVPRWYLQLPAGVTTVHTAYVGVQGQGPAQGQARACVHSWLEDGPDRPDAVERFVVLDGDDAHGADVWVAYWIDSGAYSRYVARLSLADWHAALGDGAGTVGLWCERFSTAVSRLETNYSGLDYLPGLGQLPRTSTIAHELSAYWGAARDRIPDSACDRFLAAGDARSPAASPVGTGEHWRGSNYEHMIHIRSGQFWERCAPAEAAAYERDLKPVLEEGLRHLWANARETGTLGLRYLCNVDPGGAPRRETCGAGFFRSLGDLEAWAEHHPSHLAIYHGAIAHAKTWGAGRALRTWHEVSVLKAGEAVFEYLNCAPRTGVLDGVVLERAAR